MKKQMIVLICLAVLLMAAGCETDSKKEKRDKPETESQTFTFKDVLGNEYEAPLIESLKRSSYDYSRLIEKNGYKYYTDEDGKVISRIGIDVSRYQTKVDWQAVKDSGIDFVIIRLGYRGYGEGGQLVVDEQYQSHIEGAIAAGLDVGVYFFSQAITKEEAQEEAKFVVEHLEDYEINGPVVFDTEEVKGVDARANELDKDQYTEHCVTFCKAVEEAGYEPMIYANMKWFAYSLDLTKLQEFGIWYADYEKAPQYPYQFQMWQYTETGNVPGITGNVDLNVWFTKD